MILQSDIRTFYELQPVFPVGQWWQVCLLAGAVLAVMLWTAWVYRKDSVDLNPASTFLVTSLRLLTVAAVLLFVINPGQRSETKIVKSSRLAILMDTSLSMGLLDSTSQNRDDRSVRYQQLVQWVQGPAIERLRADHDVSIYRFGDADQPELIETFAKQSSGKSGPIDDVAGDSARDGAGDSANDATGQSAEPSLDVDSNRNDLLSESRSIVWIGIVVCVLAIASAIRAVTLRRRSTVSDHDESFSRFGSWWFSGSVLLFFGGLLVVAGGDLWTPKISVAETLSLFGDSPSGVDRTGSQLTTADSDSSTPADSTVSESATDAAPLIWSTELQPQGTSTRIGSALRYIVNKEQGGPIAGIVIFTDGQSNLGIPVDRAIASATNAGIPVFTVGVGSTSRPQNVTVADLQAPQRVLPGDKFQIKALVKAFGFEGRTARVQLISVDENQSEAEIVEEETNIRLLGDGQPAGVDFAVQRSQLGKRRYEVRVESLEEDLDARDNKMATVVEVIQQRTNVLLMAGGPTREFRFLRNQLYRDKDIHLHVWLQSAQAGADQESDVLLQSFPPTRDEVYDYDCIVAIDPDWRLMTSDQTEMLERWVAEQAGGLITIAGPVNTPRWTRQPRGDETIDVIRKLYPVSFYSQGSSVLKLGRFGGSTAFPLDFTRQGRSAEYLWIGDSAGQSQETWAKFEGVFGYYAVNDAKSGAEILAYFADPDTAIDDQLPIYLASQFYGSGRVFFQASGEMWRVRRLDVDYFEQYYTKLIRWASQGRLSRDSTRGVLLTDRQRCWMGDTIGVQAILKNAQDQPLGYPQVEASLITPDQLTRSITLRSNPNAASAGSFSGNFVAAVEGEYRINLPIPESPDLEILTTTVLATIPDLEKEKPQRNDAVLAKIAENTGGIYFPSPDAFDGQPDNPEPAAQLIPPLDQETIIAGTFDRFFKRKFMMWLLGLLTMCLASEWILRRLQKLA